jgi:hypothetical protein
VVNIRGFSSGGFLGVVKVVGRDGVVRWISSRLAADCLHLVTYSFPIFIPSTVTLFGVKMSNSASEPIDLDMNDASTASKRPQ